MSNQLPALLQPGQALPAIFNPIMEAMTSSEMQANVGVSYAVVGIKGKVFSIKHGGNATPITMVMNGQTFAAPYFDVVMVRAKDKLSKTWYKDGYSDGSDDAPTCWAEDGVTPLAPLEQRPLDMYTGAPCVDCRTCPMNQFGSKTNTDTGSRGKACADTRKIAVVPMVPTGQKDAAGNDVTVMDGENIKYGGAMLLRVPAASLRVFAEYDAKLQQMGVPFFAVATRLQFDQSQAYPKFVLQGLRVLSDAEAHKVVELRESMQVRQILDADQTGSAPLPATHQLAGPTQPMTHNPPADLAQHPHAAPTPVLQQAPSNVVQMPQAVPVPPPPVQAAPLPPAFPPDGWTLHPQAPGFYYRGNDVLSEADLRATMAPPPPATVTPVAPPAPAMAQAVTPIVPPVGLAPSAGPQVTPSLLQGVDALLNT